MNTKARTGSGPRGYRNCNPGNLRHSASRWRGLRAVQTDGEFCQFCGLKWGYRALAKTLLTYGSRYGLRTPEGIIRRWAPATENDTGSYIRSVCQFCGWHASRRLNLREAETLTNLCRAIAMHENGIDPAEWTANGAHGLADVEAGVKLALEGDSLSPAAP